MSALLTFDRELSQRDSDSPRTWYDDGIRVLSQIAAELTDKDLAELIQLWPRRAERWQMHCAETLGLARDTRTIPLLMDLFDRGETHVSLAALESLQEFDPGRFTEAEHHRIFTAVDVGKPRPVTRLRQLVLATFQKRILDKPPNGS